jgi:hypothetical protein
VTPRRRADQVIEGKVSFDRSGFKHPLVTTGASLTAPGSTSSDSRPDRPRFNVSADYGLVVCNRRPLTPVDWPLNSITTPEDPCPTNIWAGVAWRTKLSTTLSPA